MYRLSFLTLVLLVVDVPVCLSEGARVVIIVVLGIARYYNMNTSCVHMSSVEFAVGLSRGAGRPFSIVLRLINYYRFNPPRSNIFFWTENIWSVV